jgi:Leucine-rich repeat (LRR) protein
MKKASFINREAVANNSGAMEQRPLKNGRKSKSLMSRFNILTYVLLVTIVVLTTVACGGGNAVMKVETDKKSIVMSGSGNITIDWGDGKKETHEIGSKSEFKHEYSGKSVRSISIKGKNITSLECGSLISLDVSKCPTLTKLSCMGGQLTSLDVSKCTELTELDCSNSQLTSLDVSKCTKLTKLVCTFSQLTSLDVNNCTELKELSLTRNPLSSDALNTLFETLNSNSGKKTIYVRGNPGLPDCNESIATNKGWDVQ